VNALPASADDYDQEDALADAAAALLEAFRAERDAGSLNPRQHAALLSLEQAAEPFARAAAEAAVLFRKPASDVTPGDLRHGWAAGRPGA